MPAPSLERMCWRPRELSYENSVAHLVRSLRTCARIRSLTTGTFNQVVKDRIAFRLSGANSVQADCSCSPGHIRPGSSEARCLQNSFRLSSKPFHHTARRKTLSIAPSHRISTRFPQREILRGNGRLAHPKAHAGTAAFGCPVERSSTEYSQARSSMVSRPLTSRKSAQKRILSRTREGGRQKIEKRTYVWRSLL